MMINTFGSLGFNGAPLIEGCAGNDLVGGVSDADEARKLRHAIGLGEASYSPIAAQSSMRAYLTGGEHMKLVAALLIIVSCFGFSLRSEAALFAATASGSPGELYILDPASGAVVQDIGPLNDNASTNYPITGLAFRDRKSVV